MHRHRQITARGMYARYVSEWDEPLDMILHLNKFMDSRQWVYLERFCNNANADTVEIKISPSALSTRSVHHAEGVHRLMWLAPNLARIKYITNLK